MEWVMLLVYCLKVIIYWLSVSGSSWQGNIYEMCYAVIISPYLPGDYIYRNRSEYDNWSKEWFVLGMHPSFYVDWIHSQYVAGNIMFNVFVFQLVFVFISRVSVDFWFVGRVCWLVCVWCEILLGVFSNKLVLKSRII